MSTCMSDAYQCSNSIFVLLANLNIKSVSVILGYIKFLPADTMSGT